MASTEGTLEQRGAAIGAVALRTPTALDSAQLVAATAALLPVHAWPAVDLRVTTVNAETGHTVLWSRDSGIDLAAAVASSYAIPGFFPPVEIDGRHYIDIPRAHFTEKLVADESLDAIVYVGLALPALVNTDELAILDRLAEHGLRVVKATNGPAFDEIADDLMNPAVRVRAAELGQDDGHRAASALHTMLGSA